MKSDRIYLHRKRRREKLLRRCANMRAAKERKRMENAESWREIGTYIVRLSVTPDGRTVSADVRGRREGIVTGTVRTIGRKLVGVMR